jgi:hypothetical protein
MSMHAHFYGPPTFGPGASAKTSEIYMGHQVIVPSYVPNKDLTQGSVIFFEDKPKGKVAIQAELYNSGDAQIRNRPMDGDVPTILGVARSDTGLQSASGTETTTLTVGVRGFQTVHNYWRGLKLKIGTHVGFAHMYHPEVAHNGRLKPGNAAVVGDFGNHNGAVPAAAGGAPQPKRGEHQLYAWAIHPTFDVQPGMIADLDPLSCAKVCRMLYDSHGVPRGVSFMYLTRLGTVTKIPSRSGRPVAADDGYAAKVPEQPGADIEILMHPLTSSWQPMQDVDAAAAAGAARLGRPANLEAADYVGVDTIFAQP